MKKLKKWFLNLSIQRKYLYCTLGITLVVLLATSFFQFMSASEIVTEQTVKQSAGVINELSVNLDHYFDMVENSFEYIANNILYRQNWNQMNHINLTVPSFILIIQGQVRSDVCCCRDIRAYI